jgi:hypothetical protein
VNKRRAVPLRARFDRIFPLLELTEMSGTNNDQDDVLEVLYRLGGDSISKSVHIQEVGMHFDHWPKDRFWATAKAAEGNDLLKATNNKGFVALTLAGRRRVEDRLNPATHVTTNTLNIGTNINSPVQQAGALANQSQVVTYSGEQRAELARFISALEMHIAELGLDA